MGSHSPSRATPPVGAHPAWLDLDRLWQLAPEQMTPGSLPVSLTPGWRLLLLGDGHTTRNLQILTGRTIQAHVLESLRIDSPESEHTSFDLDCLGQPLIRRQVWLSQTGSDQALLYAVSWWNQDQLQATLPDPQQPIGRSLMQARLESFRELQGICQGYNSGIEDLFQHPGPFLGRHYLLWQGGQPLTLIYEVFSPVLSLYLEPG